MNDSKPRPSFFADRWEVFVTAEHCQENEDTDYLQMVQRNVVDGELRRIAAATEALGDDVPASAGTKNRLEAI
jgi:hypothetical protein